MSTRTTGRPRHYTPDQVREAIDIVEASNNGVTAASVKRAMVMELAVSGGINAQILEKEVERHLAERKAARMTKLVEALPQASVDVADRIAASIRAEALGHLAVELEQLRRDAARKVEDRENDLAAQRDRNAMLGRQIIERDAEITTLEDRVAALSEELATARAESAGHAKEVEQLRQREDISGQLAAMVRELRLSLIAGTGAEPGGSASGRAIGTGSEAPDPARSRTGKAAPSGAGKAPPAGEARSTRAA